MTKLSGAISGLKWGKQLYYFHYLDICIYQMSTHFKIITLSTNEIYEVNIRETRTFVASEKYEKIFFTSLIHYKQGKGYTLFALTLKDKSLKKVPILTINSYEHINLFISADENYLDIITADGYVYKVCISTLQRDDIMDLQALDTNRFFQPWDLSRVDIDRESFDSKKDYEDFLMRWFYVPDQWFNTEDNMYETYVIRGENNDNSFTKLELDISRNKFEILPKNHYFKQKDFRFSTGFTFCKKSNLWTYQLFNKVKGKYRIICVINKNDSYFCHFEITTNNNYFYSKMHELNENQILFHFTDVLYLCDVANKSVKAIKIKQGKAMDICFYHEIGYIIPLYFAYKKSKAYYTINDFEDTDIVVECN